ncbi:hypothetical protein PMAL9190_01059 [Photobacterium malacitanum]|uniref:Uncharacterized protein n=1 Tax=Photobacterium malacitanum TaxID=2204294 RepID=A0A1Y6MCW7_9GAMM|nr:hypothetical protein [Photobacterium malacitanum]SMY33600.1 hypothetical protein PMAL9190_01059 [Photobacterium malacitanum]
MATISIPRISDNYLIKVFVNDLLLHHEKYGLTNQTKVVISLAGINITISVGYNEEKKENEISSDYHDLFISLENSSSNSIQSIYFNDDSKPNSQFTYRRSQDSFIDTITINDQTKTEDVVLIQHKVHTELLRHTDMLTHSMNSENNIFPAHHDVLTKLEGLNANLIEKQHEHNRLLEQEKHAFLELNGEKHQTRLAELEDEFKSKRELLDNEYLGKDAALKIREQAVEDKDNRTTRRNTTTSMLKEVQAKATQFNFSPSVNRRSFITVLLCSVLIFVAILNTYTALTELHNINYTSTLDILRAELRPTAEKPSEMLWFLYVRIFLGSTLFITSVLYLIKWANSWADRIAQQELENQKFVRDLNRAHLTIEMCLEWNEKKDGSIPDKLLTAMTEGLFKDKTHSSVEINHPIDQLASALVKSAEKIEFPIGNGKITTSGKAVNKQKAPKQDIPKKGAA